MQLAPLALLVQDSAPSSFYLTSSLEGILTISVWLVPIMLGALAAVSPAKSKRFYPLLLPGFLAAIFITLMACGRLFFAGYMLAQGELGDATLSGEDSMRFSAAAATAYAGFLAALATAILAMIAAFRSEGLWSALSWDALICAVNFAFDGIASIFNLFSGDAASEKLDATVLAQGQIDAWSNNPMWVGVCMAAFLICRQISHSSKTETAP